MEPRQITNANGGRFEAAVASSPLSKYHLSFLVEFWSRDVLLAIVCLTHSISLDSFSVRILPLGFGESTFPAFVLYALTPFLEPAGTCGCGASYPETVVSPATEAEYPPWLDDLPLLLFC